MGNNNHRFKFSHLMPNSWFYKLRDMNTAKNPSSPRNRARTINRSPVAPHQSYSYLQTKQRSLQKLPLSPLHHNPKAVDIHFPRDHSPKRSPPPLRPIRTRPAAGSDDDQRLGAAGDACPSSPRLRSRRLQVGSSSHVSWATAATAVAKTTSDPKGDFRESMVEMIAENDMRASPEGLEELLAWYLRLNSREYHGVIVRVFRQVLLELISTDHMHGMCCSVSEEHMQ